MVLHLLSDPLRGTSTAGSARHQHPSALGPRLAVISVHYHSSVKPLYMYSIAKHAPTQCTVRNKLMILDLLKGAFRAAMLAQLRSLRRGMMWSLPPVRVRKGDALSQHLPEGSEENCKIPVWTAGSRAKNRTWDFLSADRDGGETNWETPCGCTLWPPVINVQYSV
jgi:hypothetical protein